MSEYNGAPNISDPCALLPAEHLTYGIRFLADFWREKYLQEYIRNGGSKIKFITGREGSGKTHFLRLMTSLAREENYKTVQFRQGMSGCTILRKSMWRFSGSAALWSAWSPSAAI